MNSDHGWLAEVNLRYDDYNWLAKHIERIYDEIHTGIFRPARLHKTIDTLLLICPYLLTRSDLRLWVSLLDEALNEAALLRDDQMQMQLFWQMGVGYSRLGQHKTARVAFDAARVRAEENQEARLLLQAYIGLLQVQMYYRSSQYTPQLIQNTLGLAKEVDNLETWAEVYQIIAIVQRDDPLTALGYGQTAYACWHRLGNVQEMARTAYVLATTCRLAGWLNLADIYLETAKEFFLKTQDRLQYGLVTYEQGALRYRSGEFEAARQWFELALHEFTRLEPPHYQPYYVAAAHDYLARAQVGLQQYDEARSTLDTAIAMWKKMDNQYELARSYNLLGYLEGQRGNTQEAREWLNLGLTFCEQLPESAARRNLETLLNESLNELPAQ